MSGEELMSGTHDCGGDAAAYALGALDPGEAEEFKRHMDGCVVCRDELLAFQEVVDALPMSAVQHPVRRSLRRRVLTQVRDEARTAQRAARPARRAFPRPALAGGLLAAVVVAVVVGVVAGGSNSTHVYRASVGYAQLRVSSGHAELVVNRLPPAPNGRIYEVWLRRPNQAPSPTKALFGVTSKGAADVGVPGNLHEVSAVLVTQEPAGGSPHPTSAPVIVTPIT
jgi:anti-sigma-K factor RskA